MPVLDNPRHEIFAREIAKGANGREAYKAAGYEPTTDESADAAASRLLSDVKVELRVKEIQTNAAKRAEITVEKVLLELSKIGFSDIRKAVRWLNGPVDAGEEDGRICIESAVLMVPSADLDDETAAAISEVAQTPNGVRIKMHDKRAALVDIGRHLAMFTDKTEVTGKNGKALFPSKAEELTDEQLANIAAGGSAAPAGPASSQS